VQIPIFEKGYEKDPAVVAKEAIQEATQNKSDIVLVDTAGRMQVGLIHMLLIAFLFLSETLV
jgi:signal recognition particle GTPase